MKNADFVNHINRLLQKREHKGFGVCKDGARAFPKLQGCDCDPKTLQTLQTFNDPKTYCDEITSIVPLSQKPQSNAVHLGTSQLS